MASSALPRLLAGAADVIPRDGLQEKLSLDRPLRVKLGIDPSRPDLHLGHAVVLRKLRHFQDAGHVAVLIVGDFTGRVGDPSGQSETRPFLTEEEIETNATTYLEQAGTVLDVSSAEVRRNSEWLAGMGMADVLRLTSAYTVARMLERDDFRKRYEEGKPISVVEFLYPLMQAMDSVAVGSDVELGGTDQTFNLLMGREIQRDYGQAPQAVVTVPLLVGTDGREKMSKSLGNAIGFRDPPTEMFGRVMSIPDGIIADWFRLATDLPPERAAREAAQAAREAKAALGRAIVRRYHGEEAARAASDEFDRVFRDKGLPDEIPELALGVDEVEPDGVWIVRALQRAGLAASGSAARRLLREGGVRVDGDRVGDEQTRLAPGATYLIQVGKRHFHRVTVPAS